MDEAHKATDKALEALEARIAEVYATAEAELREKIDVYFAQFTERDKQQRELLDAGEITEQEYLQWRLAQIGRGRRFEALADDVAYRMTNANEVATAYVNDETPNIFSLNYNYTAYTIEQVHGNVGFTLMNEDAVRRLIVEEPDLLPKRRVDAPVDHAWNRKRFIAEITSGIIQGESIKKLADRVENLSDASRAGAVRNARTAVTGAQNAGRQENYRRAAEMGIQVRKRWIATKDLRTRHTHALLDGQTVPFDEPFEIDGSKLMFPGDPSGKPALVWNCRCTMRTVEKEGIEAEPRMMRVRNPVTGRNELVQEMTYDEWIDWKNAKAAEIIAKSDEEARAFFAADARDNLSAIVKRGTIKIQNGFSAFPDGDPLIENSKNVKPLKTYYDVALHGTPTAVCFGTKTANMSPRLLAAIIRHSEGYNGQNIRLLSCSTGRIIGDEYCFAEELANALGVKVKAPNDVLYISKRGGLSVGDRGDGKFVTYKPNQRRRMK